MARRKLSFSGAGPSTSNQPEAQPQPQRRTGTRSRRRRSSETPENMRRRTLIRTALQQGPLRRSPRIQEIPIRLPVPERPNRTGSVFTAGTGDIGQLGLGTNILEALRPRKVNLPFPVVDIAAGGMHTVCLSADGQVFTFGCNDEGALGRNTTGNEDAQFLFDLVILPERIVQVSAGDSHTAALSEQGRVYLWGNFRDAKGSMGLTPNGQPRQNPIQIMNAQTIVQIASGCDHLVCLSNNGTMFTCGSGEQGQLGRISRYNLERGGRRGIGSLLNPAAVSIGRIRGRSKILFDCVWTGSYNTLARVQQTGEVYGFGLNNVHQLGFAESGESIPMPQEVTSFRGCKWSMISGGQHHTLAVNDRGQAYALGAKEYGRLGLGARCEDQSKPTPIPTAHNLKFVNVAAGDHVSFAISTKGTLYSWGMGTNGQLGHGTIDDVVSPAAVHAKAIGQKNIIKVAGGGQHTVILIEN